MKIHARVLTLALAGVLSLSLAACGQPAITASPTPGVSGAPEQVTFLPDNAVDLAQKILGIPGSTPLMTVNDIPVTAEQYLYFLTTNISSYQQYLAQYGMTAIDWTQESDGQLLGDYMKNESRDTALSYALFDQKAKEKNLSVSAEEMKLLTETRAGVITEIGGDAAYGDALQRLGVSDSTLWWTNTAGSLYSVLMTDALGEPAPINDPTDEEFAAYIIEKDILSAKHILLLTKDPQTNEAYDAETIAKQKATAEDLLAQLRASSDPITLFDTLMNEFSEDSGLPSNPDGYVFSAGEMVPPFEEGTRALEFGKISDIIESDFGFHIILRQDPATEAVRAQCKTDSVQAQTVARETEFGALMDTWMTDATVTYHEAFETLNAQTYYEGVLAFRAELDAANATPAPSPELVSPEVSPEGSATPVAP